MDRLSPRQLELFSRNLRAARVRAGLTQEALAESAGISARYYQLLETGRFAGSISVLIRLRRAMGCSFESLLRDLR